MADTSERSTWLIPVVSVAHSGRVSGGRATSAGCRHTQSGPKRPHAKSRPSTGPPPPPCAARDPGRPRDAMSTPTPPPAWMATARGGRHLASTLAHRPAWPRRVRRTGALARAARSARFQAAWRVLCERAHPRWRAFRPRPRWRRRSRTPPPCRWLRQQGARGSFRGGGLPPVFSQRRGGCPRSPLGSSPRDAPSRSKLKVPPTAMSRTADAAAGTCTGRPSLSSFGAHTRHGQARATAVSALNAAGTQPAACSEPGWARRSVRTRCCPTHTHCRPLRSHPAGRPRRPVVPA